MPTLLSHVYVDFTGRVVQCTKKQSRIMDAPGSGVGRVTSSKVRTQNFSSEGGGGGTGDLEAINNSCLILKNML
jgi:hypothetical protein